MSIPDDATAHDLYEALSGLQSSAAELHNVLLSRPSQWDPAAALLANALDPLDGATKAADLAVKLSPPRPKGHRKGGWVHTYTGRQFWPLDPRPGDVDARDIAYQLAGKFRYQASTRYTVAAHSVAVMRMAVVIARKEGMTEKMVSDIAAIALLHDSDEAYLPDVPRPVKPYIPGWGLFELGVRQAVHARFALEAVGYEAQMIVKECDDHALALEIEALNLNERGDWADPGRYPTDADVAEAGRVEVLSPEASYDLFMEMLAKCLPEDVLKPREPAPAEDLDTGDPEQLAEAFLALPPPERVAEHGLALSTRLARLVAGPVDQPVEEAKPKGTWLTEAAPATTEDPRVARNRQRLLED